LNARLLSLSRPLLAEIQCLVGTCHNTQSGKIISKRAADGFPMQRLLLICAVIEKRLRLSLWNRDVYLNVVGGLRLSEPSTDCAVAVAIISSLTNTAIRPGTAFIGELGLGGELRGAKKMEQRIAEAMKVGFRRVIIPANPTSNVGEMRSKWSRIIQGIEVIPCHNLKEAIEAGLETNNVDDLISKQRRRCEVSVDVSNISPSDGDEENNSGLFDGDMDPTE
jgi:DNA repair protein RadA/Sms